MQFEYIIDKRIAHRETQLLQPRQMPDSFARETCLIRTRQSLAECVLSAVALPTLRARKWWNDDPEHVALFPWADLVAPGERWSKRASFSMLGNEMKNFPSDDVLVQGCGRGLGLTEYFLRRGAQRVTASDPIPLCSQWASLNRQFDATYGRTVNFVQSSVEATQFADASFDIVSSEAVYEHVQSLERAVDESYRILKPGGVVFHAIGPLYCTFGGDHCSGDITPGDGFNHLFLPDADYRASVDVDSLYENCSDPNCNFWAKNGLFSFARTADYLNQFGRMFSRRFVLVVVSEGALAFRREFRQRWNELKERGFSDGDLFAKSIYVCYRRE